MIRRSYRLISKLSPFFAWVISESYYTLVGGRFEDLKTALINRGTISNLSFEWTLVQTKTATPNHSRIAFISCLPPDKTGIATYSLYSWLDTDRDVDIFCLPYDDDWFFGLQRYVERRSSGHARIFDVRSFLTADMNQNYEFIVIALGNSDHFKFVLTLIEKLSSFGDLDRLTLYLHDACCLNVLMKGLYLDYTRFLSYLRDIYPEIFAKFRTRSKGPHPSLEMLAESGIMGIRYFYQKGIKSFIVNSEAAAQLVKNDIHSDDISLDILFNPIFAPIGDAQIRKIIATPNISHESGIIRIGTFGILGASKCTDLILSAVALMAKRGDRVHLTLAGYNAHEYCLSRSRILKKFPHTIVNAPTDLQLWTLMNQVDLAIQLRLKNTGESSGIVSHFIKLRKPMILSDIGSFVEIGRDLGPDVATISKIFQVNNLPTAYQL